MTIGEVINLLVKIFNFLSGYLADLFASAEGETDTEADA